MTVDSTMRGSFVSCPHKYFREYFQHYKSKYESVDLVAGKAFASGVEAVRHETWVNRASPDDALAAGVRALIIEWGDFEAPEGHNKQLDRMVGALDEYFKTYGYLTDYITPMELPEGKHAIEFSFALPIPNTQHPTTGDPILYTGRFDMLGLYNKSLFVVDEKTTKQLGASWNKNWVLRSQLTGYCWAAQQFDYPVTGAIIRGISILKTKYGHAEVIVYRPQWFIDQWMAQLQRDVARMIQCWKDEVWDMDLDTACTNYGGCLFMDVCNSNSPQRVLDNDFSRRVWNPLEREENDYVEDRSTWVMSNDDRGDGGC